MKNVQVSDGTYFADLDRRAAFFPTRKEAEVLDRGREVLEVLDRMRGLGGSHEN